jgi:CHASE2 domain-containing sensor protein
MYGVEIHATIAANLLDRSWIRRLPVQTEVGMLAVVAFVITFLSASFSLLPGALTATGGACAWLWFSYYSFVHAFRFIPGATLALVLVLCLIIGRWGIEGMMNVGLRKMFSHFAKPGK